MYASQPCYQEEPAWRHTAKTFQWVSDSQARQHHRFKTELWTCSPADLPRLKQACNFNDVVARISLQAERWMQRQERLRQTAALREREKSRMIQEEIRRIEERIQQKVEDERRRKVRESVERLVAEKKARMLEDEQVKCACARYDRAWSDIGSSGFVGAAKMTFESVPWPVVHPPRSVEDLQNASTIAQFLFSRVHSRGESRKQRIRSALLRFHPDRAHRLLDTVVDNEGEREKVERGIGVVARCLNDLMEAESRVVGGKL